MSVWPAIVAVSLVLLVGPGAVAAQGTDCRQEPGNRFFWVERAFCSLPAHGPERALGIIIWNHGIHGTTQSWMAPAPPVFRLLQRRGWDVVMLKRHHLGETAAGSTLYRTVQRTLEEVATARKAGYRKVVLAGQSFGGYVTLEAIDTSPGIDAAIAFAPGVRSASAAGGLDPSVTDRLLQSVRVGRLALVFPKHDALFNYLVRGENAQGILARRKLPHLLVDETSEISGHGGAVTGRFALRYGLCLADFLAAPELPAGRFACPPAPDAWPLVRELLLPTGRPTLVAAGAAFPEPVGALRGLRWAYLEDTAVLVAPVDEGGRLRLLYRSTGFGGGVFDATVADGAIRAVLSNKSTVTLQPGSGEGTITWMAANGARTLSAPLVRGGE
jgi:pimeloyl-ACP methyl ester carboxylesterase